MTLKEALAIFKESAFGNEELDSYVFCDEGVVLITKGEDEAYEDDDDLIVGDVVYFLVSPNGRVKPVIPPDVDYDDNDIKKIV